MDRDVLSDVLSSAGLCAGVTTLAECAPPWAVEVPAAAEVAAALLPGADHAMAFHAVVRGACCLTPAGGAPVPLAAGALAILPRGTPHLLSSEPGLRGEADHRGGEPPPRRLRRGGAAGGATPALVLSGLLGCEARPFDPGLAALPPVLTATAAEGGERLAALLALAGQALDGAGPEAVAGVARLAPLLLPDLVRRHLPGLPPGQAGLLAGLRDEATGRALARLHAMPAEAWTLQRLAREAGLSRSALAERFARVVGEPPMHYLARWRMQLAVRRIAEGASVLAAAAGVGYRSEAAFSRAFRRTVGAPPAAFAAARRQAAGSPARGRRGGQPAEVERHGDAPAQDHAQGQQEEDGAGLGEGDELLDPGAQGEAHHHQADQDPHEGR